VERMLMALLCIFGCPVAVILFVHRTRRAEMCKPGADDASGDGKYSRKIGAVF
jgi:hypothetical protein